jgi:hypothetical protein
MDALHLEGASTCERVVVVVVSKRKVLWLEWCPMVVCGCGCG